MLSKNDISVNTYEVEYGSLDEVEKDLKNAGINYRLDCIGYNSGSYGWNWNMDLLTYQGKGNKLYSCRLITGYRNIPASIEKFALSKLYI